MSLPGSAFVTDGHSQAAVKHAISADLASVAIIWHGWSKCAELRALRDAPATVAGRLQSTVDLPSRNPDVQLRAARGRGSETAMMTSMASSLTEGRHSARAWACPLCGLEARKSKEHVLPVRVPFWPVSAMNWRAPIGVFGTGGWLGWDSGRSRRRRWMDAQMVIWPTGRGWSRASVSELRVGERGKDRGVRAER